jgi:uncharacterized membrane protein (DUF106 family)
MNTVEVKLGYLFWYFVIAISVVSLISSLYNYIS